MADATERYVDYLDFTCTVWKRPEGPTRVWKVIEGRKETEDGKVPKFSIQEVPEELKNDVIDFMIEYFVTEEPANVAVGTRNDTLAIREYRTMYRDILSQGVTVVALKVNDDPSAKPVIAGVNMLTILTSEDEAIFEGLSNFRSSILKQSIGIQLNMMLECNVFEIYGVDKYLTATGLVVHPLFRGQGLGEELLRARDDIGLAYQIPASETVFTATVSQILAARVGFEVLVEKRYSELLNDDGKLAFPGVTVEYMKVMGKKFGSQ